MARDFEDEDEGQRPRFSLPGVRRFGPEDPQQDEAAHFGAVGAGRKMRRMIEHHRKLFPAGDRAMLRRKWDDARSEALRDHVDTVAEVLQIDNLEGVGVRGDNDRSRIVTLVTRTAQGRVHKSWLPYAVLSVEGLEEALESCERAASIAEAKRKGMVVGMATDHDTAGMSATIDAMRRRLDDLEASGAVQQGPSDEEEAEADLEAADEEDEGGEDGDGKDGEEDGAGEQQGAGEPSDDDLPQTVKAIKAALEACGTDAEREALKLRVRAQERQRENPRQGVLDATVPASD